MARHRGLPITVAVLVSLTLSACGSPGTTERAATAAPPAPPSGDAAFVALAHELIADYTRRHPSQATYLGIHTYDDRLEDYSRAAVADEVSALRGFRTRVSAIDPAGLSAANQLDREQVLHAIDSSLLSLEVVKPWTTYPDFYSSGITGSAYLMIKREFAPPETRLRQLIAREKLMPAVLAEARRNLENPARIYTEIAIEQADGNRGFFKDVVAAAFPAVTDAALLAEFKQANDAVVAALGEYKTWLETDLLKRSTGSFAFGAETYRKKLAADEMIEVPLEQLLAVAEADLRKNQTAFAETARQIDAKKTPRQVLAMIEADHPPPAKLLAVTQGELDAIGRFMSDRHIVTVPNAPPAKVQETPPFLRATTSASMEIPGPFEATATEAYYNMTLPDPKSSARETSDFMRQWYFAAISNVSVHEVWPGHYLQFLYAKQFPSEVRKVFGAASNAEGWAHYCEQMVIDEGFHAGDPRYRLAQIQDALLRDARFVVGIKLHTQGMTVPEAEAFFVKEAYQAEPVARSETKRGTSDATYGYYTMGKLMILKLRDDYRGRQGSAYSLQGFHDTFIKLGPLPLPLIRKAMLGEVGTIF